MHFRVIVRIPTFDGNNNEHNKIDVLKIDEAFQSRRKIFIGISIDNKETHCQIIGCNDIALHLYWYSLSNVELNQIRSSNGMLFVKFGNLFEKCVNHFGYIFIERFLLVCYICQNGGKNSIYCIEIVVALFRLKYWHKYSTNK